MSKTVKKIGKAALGAVTTVATGGLVNYKNGGFTSGLATDAVTEGLATVTGAKAMQERMNREAELQQQQQRRQALVSDALANAAANEETANVQLGRRTSRSGRVNNAAGLGGVPQSSTTGVQQ